MTQKNLTIIAVLVFVLFVIYLIMKRRHGAIERKRKEDGRFRFHKDQ